MIKVKLLKWYYGVHNQKVYHTYDGYIIKSAIVSFCKTDRGVTVLLQGYFSQQVDLTLEEFAKLYTETK